jgi:hypothetical protein
MRSCGLQKGQAMGNAAPMLPKVRCVPVTVGPHGKLQRQKGMTVLSSLGAMIVRRMGRSRGTRRRRAG